jgi:hypothetical protein
MSVCWAYDYAGSSPWKLFTDSADDVAHLEQEVASRHLCHLLEDELVPLSYVLPGRLDRSSARHNLQYGLMYPLHESVIHCAGALHSFLTTYRAQSEQLPETARNGVEEFLRQLAVRLCREAQEVRDGTADSSLKVIAQLLALCVTLYAVWDAAPEAWQRVFVPAKALLRQVRDHKSEQSQPAPPFRRSHPSPFTRDLQGTLKTAERLFPGGPKWIGPAYRFCCGAETPPQV